MLDLFAFGDWAVGTGLELLVLLAFGDQAVDGIEQAVQGDEAVDIGFGCLCHFLG